MIFSNILVPFDGSELSVKSIEKAIEIAKLNPAVKVNVIHVVQLPLKKVPKAIYEPVKQAILEDGRQSLKLAEEKLAEISGQSEVFLVEGSPLHAILNEAERLNSDVIIMGSRGLSGFKEFLGSVSHYITQNSKIPVLLMK